MRAEEKPRLNHCLKQLRLPSFAANAYPHAGLAANEGWPHVRYLLEPWELGLADRGTRKVARLLAESGLPREETAATFDQTRLETGTAQKWEGLKNGEFLERRENVPAFGNPGGGKTHLPCALGHELVQRGYAILFITRAMLVQKLLSGKAALRLEKEPRGLDKYDGIIID